jgi:predicted Zn-dependent peptidase
VSKYCIVLLLLLGDLMASSLPKHYSETFKNGLQIVVIPQNNNSGVVSTDIFYKVGSRNETMGKSGIAHMLEHMNFKSTKKLKAGEYDKIVKSYGGVTNASTGFDYTHYYIKSSSKNMKKSFELFAEMMKNLKLLDKEFQPERKVVTEERRWRTDNNPQGFLWFGTFNNAFLYHPYHWMPIGFTDDILNWDIEDIKEFHKTYYQPKNAIIVVSGDIDEKDVFKSAKKYFRKIKNRAKIKDVYTKEPIQNGGRRAIIHKDTDVPMIALAFKTPDFKHKDQVALSAISELLSDGKSSIFQKTLVKKRLVNQIYAYNMDLVDPGVFLIFAICNKDVDVLLVEKEILKELNKLTTKEIAQKEIEKIKTNTKSDFIFSLESSSGVASLFGDFLAKGDLAPLLTYEDEVDKLTPTKIKDVATKYFDKKSLTTVILQKGE